MSVNKITSAPTANELIDKVNEVIDNLGGSTLSGLSDVTITSPTNGQMLGYDGTKWINTSVPTNTVNTFTNNTGTTLDTQLTLNSPLIFRNGVLLTATTDYTISGSVITFVLALVSSDIINVLNSVTTGGGGRSMKVLNVAVAGTSTSVTLNRNGAKVSNFAKQKYLVFASCLDNGVLATTDQIYYKNVGENIATADSWEMVWKAHFVANSSADQNLFGENSSYFTGILARSSTDTNPNQFLVTINFTGGSQTEWIRIISSTPLVSDTTYYFKITYDSVSGYAFYYKEENASNYSLVGTNSNTRKVAGKKNWFIGMADASYGTPWLSWIDLSECYIKINNEMWWKGVEEI